MKPSQLMFQHVLTPWVEDCLANYGIFADEVLRLEDKQAIYRFSSPAGTTVVLRLYKCDEMENRLPSDWLCFEFGVGTVADADAAEVLHSACRQMYDCFVPVRPAFMPWEGGQQILVLVARAPAGAFERSYLEQLVDLSIRIADELRLQFGLRPTIEV